MQNYYEWGCSFSSALTNRNNNRQPHVYATADDAFRNMLRIIQDNNNQQLKQNRSQGDSCTVLSSPDQSILVSGESGSGKTVTTKYIMAYLASLSERDAASMTVKNANSKATHSTIKGTNAKQQQQSIEQQVLQSNPILESFGNARTIRNDNSSRFGKFISLHFHQSTLLGATIRTYLLENVQLVHQMPGERTFHVFHEQLSSNDKRKFRLVSPSASSAKDFKMTSASNTFTRRDCVSDRETFQELKVAMEVVGFTVQEEHDIFAVVSAILHSSNFTFEEQHQQHQMRRSTTTTTNVVPCSSFASTASLLGVDTDRLKDALCTCKIVVAGKSITKTLSCEQAIKANESMMKALYGALFSFLVNRINQSICGTTANNSSITEQNDVWDHHDATKVAKINVLDIFGFESFDLNSLEQLCINYCNEALQQQFNRFVFKLEQQEYEREGIEWSFIGFPDNQDVVCTESPDFSSILSSAVSPLISM
jgi:myosin-5